ncbi:MAG: methionyl-tRNA formyltransferase [Robiginitomaculum sp.]
MTLRVVFMGTPQFAVPSLSEILASGHEVVAVYTQPPRKSGRGQKLTKSPVHQFADVMGIDVRTPESFRKSKTIDGLEALGADVACVVAYGQILPVRALNAPRGGCLNLHASKLPRWRGAAPVQRAIMAGDSETAAQIMQMAKGLDTGDIVMSALEVIRANDTAGSLHDRLSHTGAQLWPPVLAALSRGGLTATPQTGAPTYAAKIDKAEAMIDWNRSAADLDCHIRGLAPFPGAYFMLAGKRVKVHMCAVEAGEDPKPVKAGTVLDDNGLIACGEKNERSALRLIRVQPAGKSAMSFADFARGHGLSAGAVIA